MTRFNSRFIEVLMRRCFPYETAALSKYLQPAPYFSTFVCAIVTVIIDA